MLVQQGGRVPTGGGSSRAQQQSQALLWRQQHRRLVPLPQQRAHLFQLAPECLHTTTLLLCAGGAPLRLFCRLPGCLELRLHLGSSCLGRLLGLLKLKGGRLLLHQLLPYLLSLLHKGNGTRGVPQGGSVRSLHSLPHQSMQGHGLVSCVLSGISLVHMGCWQHQAASRLCCGWAACHARNVFHCPQPAARLRLAAHLLLQQLLLLLQCRHLGTQLVQPALLHEQRLHGGRLLARAAHDVAIHRAGPSGGWQPWQRHAALGDSCFCCDCLGCHSCRRPYLQEAKAGASELFTPVPGVHVRYDVNLFSIKAQPPILISCGARTHNLISRSSESMPFHRLEQPRHSSGDGSRAAKRRRGWVSKDRAWHLFVAMETIGGRPHYSGTAHNSIGSLRGPMCGFRVPLRRPSAKPVQPHAA